MNYKIVSKNINIIEKAHHSFLLLNMKEAIHIQEVDFWLVDVKTIDKSSIISYKNKLTFSFLLFIVNDDEDIIFCLENKFSNYLKSNFSTKELNAWGRFFLNNEKENILEVNKLTRINFDTKSIKIKNKTIFITLQEIALLSSLSSGKFIQTKDLKNLLKVNSVTTIRTIVNRIRKKTEEDFIIQKRGYGYKLNIEKNNNQNIFFKDNSYIKDLEEQNNFVQEVVDSAPIFIATFIHKQLYCINKSFRDFLGTEIIKELWNEEAGDFFQLMEHSFNEKENFKQKLFKSGIHSIVFSSLKDQISHPFKVKTCYFEKLDKHLFIFEEM